MTEYRESLAMKDRTVVRRGVVLATMLLAAVREIESIIGGLPPGPAREHQPWWSTNSSGSHTWVNESIEAGRLLHEVSLDNRRAVFVRGCG